MIIPLSQAAWLELIGGNCFELVTAKCQGKRKKPSKKPRQDSEDDEDLFEAGALCSPGFLYYRKHALLRSVSRRRRRRKRSEMLGAVRWLMYSWQYNMKRAAQKKKPWVLMPASVCFIPHFRTSAFEIQHSSWRCVVWNPLISAWINAEITAHDIWASSMPGLGPLQDAPGYAGPVEAGRLHRPSCMQVVAFKSSCRSVLRRWQAWCGDFWSSFGRLWNWWSFAASGYSLKADPYLGPSIYKAEHATTLVNFGRFAARLRLPGAIGGCFFLFGAFGCCSLVLDL